MKIDKQYERIEAALKNPTEELRADIVKAATETVKRKVRIVPTNIEFFCAPRSSAAIDVARSKQIKHGPINSQSSKASFGDTFLVYTDRNVLFAIAKSFNCYVSKKV